jgi:hypothetical protein
VKTLGNWTIEGLLTGRPEALALFNIVRKYIESFGTVTMEVMKIKFYSLVKLSSQGMAAPIADKEAT